MLPIVLKWNWKTQVLPSVAKTSGGTFVGSGGLYFSTRLRQECPVILSAAGVKNVRGDVADELVI